MRCFFGPSVVVGLLLLALPARAQSTLDVFQIANQLGNVIGSAEACEIDINEDAVAGYISDHVPADDMSFISTFNSMIGGVEYNIGQMSGLQLNVHCVQVRRAAEANGFLGSETSAALEIQFMPSANERAVHAFLALAASADCSSVTLLEDTLHEWLAEVGLTVHQIQAENFPDEIAAANELWSRTKADNSMEFACQSAQVAYGPGANTGIELFR